MEAVEHLRRLGLAGRVGRMLSTAAAAGRAGAPRPLLLVPSQFMPEVSLHSAATAPPAAAAAPAAALRLPLPPAHLMGSPAARSRSPCAHTGAACEGSICAAN